MISEFKNIDQMNTEELKVFAKKSDELNKSVMNQVMKTEVKNKDLETTLAQREEEDRKSKKLSAQSIITYVVLVCPIILLLFLVWLDRSVIPNVMTFVTYFTGTITTPILMYFFGIETKDRKDESSKA